MDRVDELSSYPPDRTRFGWGLDITQSSGLGNWIHFAVPSVHGWSAQYIALKFYTGSVDAIVNRVDVWNLNDREYISPDFSWTGDGEWFVKVVDMGAPVDFSALGISVRIGAGVEMMSHRFIFAGACAYLEPPL